MAGEDRTAVKHTHKNSPDDDDDDGCRRRAPCALCCCCCLTAGNGQSDDDQSFSEQQAGKERDQSSKYGEGEREREVISEEETGEA